MKPGLAARFQKEEGDFQDDTWNFRSLQLDTDARGYPYESEYCEEEEKERQQQSLGEDEELELEWTGGVGAGIVQPQKVKLSHWAVANINNAIFFLKKSLNCVAPPMDRGALERIVKADWKSNQNIWLFLAESFCYSVILSIFFFEIGHTHTCTNKFLISVWYLLKKPKTTNINEKKNCLKLEKAFIFQEQSLFFFKLKKW